jgi:hypothetical protein
MAKKSASARSGAQARRNVALVRDGQQPAKSDQSPDTSATAAAGGATEPTTAPASAPFVKAPSVTAAATATKSATSTAPARSTAPPTTPKPAAPKPSVPVAKAPTAAKAQARSIARAQTVLRNRVVGLISAENYTYVRHDLLLTIGVASAMVVVMIILTFVLPHYIK